MNTSFPSVATLVAFLLLNLMLWVFPTQANALTPSPAAPDETRVECRGCIVNFDSSNHGPQCPAAGNPINVATGNKFHKETIRLSEDVNVDLYYNSLATFDHSGIDSDQVFSLRRHLAKGWLMSFEAHIGHFRNGGAGVPPGFEVWRNVEMARPDGRILRFRKATMWSDGLADWDGEWEATDSHNKERLFRQNNGAEWKFLRQDGGIEIYATQVYPWTGGSVLEQSVLKSIRPPGGAAFSLASQPGKTAIRYITSNDGQQFRLNYLDSSYTQLKSIEHLGQDKVWLFGYDPLHDNLTQITYPDGTTKTFHYEYNDGSPAPTPGAYNLLTGITDRNGGRFATYGYDAHRLARTSEHAGGAQRVRVHYTHSDSDERIRTVYDSLDRKTTYVVTRIGGKWQLKSVSGPGCSSCTNADSVTEYDASNNLVSKTIGAKTTSYYEHDRYGQYAYMIEAEGTPEERRIDYTWLAGFNKKPLTITEPSVYAGQHKVTTYSYNQNGDVTSVSEAGYDVDGNPVDSVTSYQYNGPNGQLSMIDGPRVDVADVTLFKYHPDSPGAGYNRARLEEVTNAAGVVIRNNIEYSATGQVVSEDNPNGISTTYTYYPDNDRLETVTKSHGSQSMVTHMTYLDSGELASITHHYGTPAARTVYLEYDAARRLIEVKDALGNYMTYKLDTEGNVNKEKTFDHTGLIHKKIINTYDDYNQLDTVTQSDVMMDLNYGSDGNLYDLINGRGVQTEHLYDALNRLTNIKQDTIPVNGSTAIEAETIFEHNVHDLVIKTTDANGHATEYEYDDLGRQTRMISPDTGETTFAHDQAGNIISKTDANGQTTAYSYDALNRPVSIDYAGTQWDVTFQYDQGTHGLMQLTSFSNSANLTQFTYDAFGQLTEKTQTDQHIPELGQVVSVTSYVYDQYGRVDTITYPSGMAVTLEYNGLDQIESMDAVIDGVTIDVVDQVKYLPMGPIETMQFGKSLLNYSTDYDDGYRLNGFMFGSAYISGFMYDDNHNIIGINGFNTQANKSFQYDNLDRVTHETNGSSTSDTARYTYDAVGNRTGHTFGMQPAVDYHYDPSSNRLLHVGRTAGRVYDNNGQVTAIPLQGDQWTYNSANRMAEYRSNGLIKGQYNHNGIGQRTHKVYYNDNQAAKHFVFSYNQLGQLIGQYKYNAGGVLKEVRELIWLDKKPVAQVRKQYNNTGQLTADKLYYILADHLNTPRKVATPGGQVVWSWDSDAFGLLAPDELVGGSGKPFEFNLRFPGQYHDIESGQFYNYFRDYEPATGRYLQSDPIGLDGGMNTYAYVGGNPLSTFDEFGLKGMKNFNTNQQFFDYFSDQCADNCMVAGDLMREQCKRLSRFGAVHTFSICMSALTHWELSICPKDPPPRCDEAGECP